MYGENDTDGRYAEAVALLAELVRVPSFSGEEGGAADVMAGFLAGKGVEVRRKGNNLWAYNRHYDPAKSTILLNSHLDTVKPNPGYLRDPFDGAVESGRLYGLGSNDAGASAVALTAAFLRFYDEPGLSGNLCLALTAEEERSGRGGIESVWPELGPVAYAVVGEPTGVHPAVAEKGLLVLDCVARGKAGHAARKEGVNAIYEAMRDIEWFRTYRFAEVSPLLGEVNMAVTVIEAGTQHNVVPAECRFTVDVRVTERYTLEEVLETVRKHVACEATPRSVRLRPSSVPEDNPFLREAVALGRVPFGSPTLSDQALLPVPSLKMGPGDSARSHAADEYVELSELREGIALYIRILERVLAGKAKGDGTWGSL